VYIIKLSLIKTSEHCSKWVKCTSNEKEKYKLAPFRKIINYFTTVLTHSKPLVHEEQELKILVKVAGTSLNECRLVHTHKFISTHQDHHGPKQSEKHTDCLVIYFVIDF
jgi:hypothetical protein